MSLIDREFPTTIDLPKRQRPSRGSRFLAWLKRAWVPVVLVGVALVSCTTVTLNHSPKLSAYDEWVYFDAVTKVPTQGIVHQGEHIGQAALAEMACYGDPYGARGAKCTGPNGNYSDYANFPLGGVTSADIYTPVYFAITWAIAQPIQWLTGLDLLTAARLTGFFWLAGGLVAFSALARELKLRRLTTLGLGLIAIGTVPSMFAFTYITTDAPSFLFGALLLYFGVRFVRGTLSGWWLIPLSVAAVLVKVTNLFALGLVAIYLVLYAIMRWRRDPLLRDRAPSPPRILLIAALSTIAALAAEIGWLVIHSAIAVGPGPDQGINTPLSIRGVAGKFLTFVQVPYTDTGNGLLMLPYSLLVIAGVIGFLLAARGRGTKRALSIATAAAITLFPPILVVGMGAALGSAFPVSTRYVLPLMPAILLAIGFVTRNRVMTYLLVGYGAVLVLALITRSFVIPDPPPITYFQH
jgi:hypothetical protein